MNTNNTINKQNDIVADIRTLSNISENNRRCIKRTPVITETNCSRLTCSTTMTLQYVRYEEKRVFPLS